MGAKRISIIWSIPVEKFHNAIESSQTIAEALRKLDLHSKTGHRKTFLERCERENISIVSLKERSKEWTKNHIKGANTKLELNDILVEDSTYCNSHLKPRLIKEGILEEKCNWCGQGPEWKDRPLSLVLDHINGKNNDNRRENLRFLCPNCNSQTETFGSRNKKKVTSNTCKNCGKDISKRALFCMKCVSHTRTPIRKVENRPPKEELKQMKEEHGYSWTGRQFGVSGNTIKKWLNAPDPE